MSYKVEVIDKKYEKFLVDIKEYFHSGGDTIHKARNEIKVIDYHDERLVVKSFKVPNLINQIVYPYIRGSKAKKSYQNAIKVSKLDVNTPQPIGYIEFYKGALLKESFFVSKLFEYDFMIREPLYEKDFEDRQRIIKEFVRFTYNLHQKGIYHKDFSAGNTLVKRVKDGYEFSIVDINRMEFDREFGLEFAMENFNKLWLEEDVLTIIAKEYASVSGYDETKCIESIIYHDRKLKDFVLRRRAIKAFFKGKK